MTDSNGRCNGSSDAGPQPCNQIAGSFAEQYRRALRPRRPSALESFLRRHRREILPIIREWLADDFEAARKGVA